MRTAEVINREIAKLQHTLKNAKLSGEENQMILDAISERKREIESLSIKSHQATSTVNTKIIAERPDPKVVRLDNNRVYL